MASLTRSVVPGITDAGELSKPSENEDSTQSRPSVYGDKTVPVLNDDKEAEIKNLSFQGVPNSVLSDHTNSQHGERISLRSTRKAHTSMELPTSAKERLFNQMFSNGSPTDSNGGDTNNRYGDNIWKKEFNQAFKKISVLSRLRNIKTSSYLKQVQNQQQRRGNNGDDHLNEINEQDIYTQKLAADLIDLLLAGCPAALFPSTQFLRDEHDHRRAPLLLAMLSVKVEPYDTAKAGLETSDLSLSTVSSATTSSSVFSNFEDKKHGGTYYKLNMEYGVGENRMKWSTIKTYKELATMHKKLKLVFFQQNTINKLYIDHNRYHKIYLPHFPRFKDAEQRLRLAHVRSKNAQANNTTNDAASAIASFRSSMNLDMDKLKMRHLQDLIDGQDDYYFQQPMHLRLERYLKLLNLSMCLRPQANRLFQFYEFSPISNLLSYEDGYQGKEGYLVIRSTAKSQGWRVSHFKLHDFKDMIERHTNKWFLVRHSYITYVSDLHSTTPLDVFLVDSKFKVRRSGSNENLLESDIDWNPKNSSRLSANILITLENSERKLQIITTSEYSMKQWLYSITQMTKFTIWSQPHRFGSFAPVRKDAFCKFLVDGRDYFWALSEALQMAEDVIYIHDWWLSPELYMRRPVKGNQEYRIDRILKERAENGVKVFIVVYRNVGNTVGTDSLWTKHSMLTLHPNIHLIRSPNQWLQNTYFWAHHEKMTVIDNTIAFMGGIDLCYGRYDTPEHVLRDDHDDLKDQIFPGKDYSNARVCDFYDLDKPFESMYDRRELPRMPWHDVHMMTVGEAARDMARHFVQRWNYLLRQKRPSRPTPLLTPPSDFTSDELENSSFFKALKARSTCEVQVLRSTGNWSMGLKETERSIHEAYLKLIETSEHYIYIENQFFITTSRWDGVVIENKIGDAIVDRIIRANSEGKVWKAFIIIPLMPGFDSPIDQPEASSLRVIMQCQYQSISRGETSIFSRLKKLNIDPIQYIQFFSLRKWSTIGPHDKLVTEQLYVHAKLLIADDRSCIIGSANINERSQAGNRDSEVAIIIRDTDLVKTKMNNQEYYAGRFQWELRQRLMREHLGCDVDLVEIVERKFGRLEELAKINYKTLHTLGPGISKKRQKTSAMIELGYREVFECNFSSRWKDIYEPQNIKNYGIIDINDDEDDNACQEGPLKQYEDVSSVLDSLDGNQKKAKLPRKIRQGSNYNHGHSIATDSFSRYHSFNNRAGEENTGIRDNKPISTDPRLTNNIFHQKEVEGLGPDGWKTLSPKYKESVTIQLREWAIRDLGTHTIDGKKKSRAIYIPDKEDIEGYINDSDVSDVDKWDMLKRICYLQHLCHKVSTKKGNSKAPGRLEMGAESEHTHNKHTSILEEQELDDDLIDELLGQMAPSFRTFSSSKKNLLKLKFIDPYSFEDPIADSFYEDLWFSIALRNTLLYRLVFHCQPDNAVQTWRDYKDYNRMADEFAENQEKLINLESRRESPSSEESASDGESFSAGDGNILIPEDKQVSLRKGGSIGQIPIQQLHRAEENDVTLRQMKSNQKKSKEAALKMRLSGSLLYGFNQRIFDKYTARRILKRVHGHLVVFPTEWLAKEVESKNWFYHADRLPPIEIYD